MVVQVMKWHPGVYEAISDVVHTELYGAAFCQDKKI